MCSIPRINTHWKKGFPHNYLPSLCISSFPESSEPYFWEQALHIITPADRWNLISCRACQQHPVLSKLTKILRKWQNLSLDDGTRSTRSPWCFWLQHPGVKNRWWVCCPQEMMISSFTFQLHLHKTEARGRCAFSCKFIFNYWST